MLEIEISDSEFFNDETNEFVTIKGGTLILEHSLLSISKWESKFCKPFIIESEHSYDEMIEYIKCMTINKNVSDTIYDLIDTSAYNTIVSYINAPMTATVIKDVNVKHGTGSFITNEVIYYYMTALNIPFECEKWHFNRLLTLINVCSQKSAPPKKMSKDEVRSRYAELNAKRRAMLNSKG